MRRKEFLSPLDDAPRTSLHAYILLYITSMIPVTCQRVLRLDQRFPGAKVDRLLLPLVYWNLVPKISLI
jgi:hypothetical protein